MCRSAGRTRRVAVGPPQAIAATRRAGARSCIRLAAVLASIGAAAPAHAQVVLIVNGDPITNFDIEQRGKLVQLTLHRTAPREELINDLINDKIKISVGKRFRLDITDADVDKQFAEMGGRMRMTQQPVRAGADPGRCRPGNHEGAHQGRDFLGDHRAGQVPGAVAGQRKGRAAGDGEQRQKGGADKDGKDGDDAAKARSASSTLCDRSCSWSDVAPAKDVIEARKKEAEALRARFESCDIGHSVTRARCGTWRCESRSSNHRPICSRRYARSSIACQSAT